MTELAHHYKVMSTPHIVLNETHELKGRVSEEELLAAILRDVS
jgi:thioredoxin-related protein